jgi:lipopolysaccharide/colanic/teichoic acid biosynthesis glycosyltransferase
MDVVGSLLALILCSPLFLVISILIKLTSEGPILFKQERLGQLESRFTFLKFRSMYVDSNPRIHRHYMKQLIYGELGDNSGSADMYNIYKMSSDPRVTPLGRLLRRTSLDELPQFLNVLKGEMSLVGPRPPIYYEYERYDIWHRRRVLEGKPGITGVWQVKGRSRTTFDQMVRMDLKYQREWSLWLDIKLILQTPWALLNSRGAY